MKVLQLPVSPYRILLQSIVEVLWILYDWYYEKAGLALVFDSDLTGDLLSWYIFSKLSADFSRIPVGC